MLITGIVGVLGQLLDRRVRTRCGWRSRAPCATAPAPCRAGTRRATAAARPRAARAGGRRARTRPSRTRRACASRACRRRARRQALERAGREPVALELERALDEPVSSPAVSSSPVRKCRANACPQLEPLPRPRLPARPALFTRARAAAGDRADATHVQVNRPLLDEFAVLDRLEWDVALLQEAPPRWFGELARRTPLERRARAHVAQLVALAAAASSRTEPRPDRVERGRLEPDARARPGRDRGAPRRCTLTPAAGAAPDAVGALTSTAADRVRGEPARLGADCPSRRARAGRRRGAGAVEWSGATRSCSAATSTCARRATRSRSRSCASASASASRPARTAIDHLLARGLEVVERPRRLRARGARADRRGRASDPALRPRARRRRVRCDSPPPSYARRERHGAEPKQRERAGGASKRGARRAGEVHAVDVHGAAKSSRERRRSRERRSRAARSPRARSRSREQRAVAASERAHPPSSAVLRATPLSARRPPSKGGKARGRQQTARKAASDHRQDRRARRAQRRRRGQDRRRAARGAAQEPDRPMEMVHDLARAHRGGARRGGRRGPRDRRDAQRIASGLVKRGQRQTNDVLKDLEGLLDRGRSEVEGRTRRKAAGGAAGARGRRRARAAARVRAGRTVAGDRARRPGSARASRSRGYDDLTATRCRAG